ncbi:MAG: response regulator [Acidobacteria bacterium]|nr:response regulator [Acidobacteriota bacterium]
MPETGTVERSTLGSQEYRGLVVVDDEEIVLTSLRSLIAIATDCRIDCYTEPKQALESIRRNGADLVIADYSMPEMDGMEFLSCVRDFDPEITRVLLTGYADKDSAIKAINQVALFHYVEKPWDNDQLLLIIRNGLERRLLLKQVREKISRLDDAHAEVKEMQMKLLKAFL